LKISGLKAIKNYVPMETHSFPVPFNLILKIYWLPTLKSLNMAMNPAKRIYMLFGSRRWGTLGKYQYGKLNAKLIFVL